MNASLTLSSPDSPNREAFARVRKPAAVGIARDRVHAPSTISTGEIFFARIPTAISLIVWNRDMFKAWCASVCGRGMQVKGATKCAKGRTKNG